MIAIYHCAEMNRNIADLIDKTQKKTQQIPILLEISYPILF